MKTLIVICCLLYMQIEARSLQKRATNEEFRMCVPENLYESCMEMTTIETKSPVKILCIKARDRIDCIDKIEHREADFGTYDPEDLWVAGTGPHNEEFTVFEEIRTNEEPAAEFRYEGVAVIHKDLDITNVKGLKGLKSCHTGIGRNVGYKIPLTKLKNMGIIGSLADETLSPRENELKAFSELFSKACIVGKWSEDPQINSKFKQKYSNLCALCENPSKCDYPDLYSGYEGALRCLAHNGGQVAWTKVIYVRKFFGLPVGNSPAKSTNETAENFSYFCPDGTKQPVSTEKPCRWAARPWQGYMSNAALIKNINDLRRKIENLNNVGQKTNANWLSKVLEITGKNIPKETKPISPKDYLDKANYTDVIEREYGPPYKSLRFCFQEEAAKRKCHQLRETAFSHQIRPRITCVYEKDCMQIIRDDGADIGTYSADYLPRAIEEFDLKVIAAEKYVGNNYAIAVVKKDSDLKSLQDLKGKKSCHYNKYYPGIYGPLNALNNANLLKRPEGECSEKAILSVYFDINDDRLKKSTIGALECLDKEGDVAFLESAAFDKLPVDVKVKYQILCPQEGNLQGFGDYDKCNLMKVPENAVVTNNQKNKQQTEEIQDALVSMSEVFGNRPDWFLLFGAFEGEHNLLFSDYTNSLVSVSDFSLENIKNGLNIKKEICV